MLKSFMFTQIINQTTNVKVLVGWKEKVAKSMFSPEFRMSRHVFRNATQWKHHPGQCGMKVRRSVGVCVIIWQTFNRLQHLLKWHSKSLDICRKFRWPLIGDMGIVKSDMWMNRLTEYNDVIEIEIISMTINPTDIQATLDVALTSSISEEGFSVKAKCFPVDGGTGDVHDLKIYLQFMQGLNFAQLQGFDYKLSNNNSIQHDRYHIYQYEKVYLSSEVEFALGFATDDSSFVGDKPVSVVFIETHTNFVDGVTEPIVDSNVLSGHITVHPTPVSYMYSPKMVLDQSNTTALQMDSLLYLCHSSPERKQKGCVVVDLASSLIKHLPYKITLLIGYNNETKTLFVMDNKFRPMIYNAHDGSLEYTSQKNFELERQKPDFVSSIELDGETQQADVTFEADTFSVLGGYGLKKGDDWVLQFYVN